MKNSPNEKYLHPLKDYLDNQSAEETIKVLEEVMEILVIHTEYVGLSDRFVNHYLTIQDLKRLFERVD